MKESKLFPIFTPIFVIALGALTAYIFHLFIDEWAWVALSLVYWGSSFLIAYKALGKKSIQFLFQKPVGSKGWLILSVVVGLIPLSILLLNLNLLVSYPLVTALWVLFAFVNPFFEQVFWRGYLLQKLPFRPIWRVGYSTALICVEPPAYVGNFFDCKPQLDGYGIPCHYGSGVGCGLP